MKNLVKLMKLYILNNRMIQSAKVIGVGCATLVVILPVKLILNIMCTEYNIFVCLSLATLSCVAILVKYIILHKDIPKASVFIFNFFFSYSLYVIVSLWYKHLAFYQLYMWNYYPY